MTDNADLRTLYAYTAAYYESHIIPAFGPLAENFAQWIILCVYDHLNGGLFDPFDLPRDLRLHTLPTLTALDLGTGTGILARQLAPYVRHVIGLDLSPHMLREAIAAPKVHYLLADLHALPIAPGTVGLVTASFGLNAASPLRSLRAIKHVLRTGGILAFQEWGALDRASQLIDETMDDHAPPDVALDPALLRFYDRPKRWYDELQDREDYYLMLKRSGFAMVWVKEASFTTVHFPSTAEFMRAKLAWPLYRLTLDALTPEAYSAFEADLRERLRPFSSPDGGFDWSPPLFRVLAIR